VVIDSIYHYLKCFGDSFHWIISVHHHRSCLIFGRCRVLLNIFTQDEAEQAMRDMDKEGRGHLSNAAVYNMMREQMQMQRDLFKFKKVVAG
jgi:hypothetical protein